MPPQGGANTFFDIFLIGEHSKKMVGMKPSRIFRCFFKWQALVTFLHIFIVQELFPTTLVPGRIWTHG